MAANCSSDLIDDSILVAARAHIAAERFQDARLLCEPGSSEYDELIGPDPEFTAAEAELAAVQGDYGSAADLRDRLVEVGYENFEESCSERFLVWRPGWWWQSTRRLDAAAAAFRAAEGAAPDRHWLLALLYFSLDRFHRTLVHLGQTVVDSPERMWVRGLALLACKRIEEASEVFTELQNRSDLPDARWMAIAGAALILILRRDYEAALEAYNRAICDRPCACGVIRIQRLRVLESQLLRSRPMRLQARIRHGAEAE